MSLLSAPARAWRARPAGGALAQARMCYRHLAGAFGVACLAAFERASFLQVSRGAFALTTRGIAWFESTGRSVAQPPPGKPCLDWTERRNHLGGPLGALLADHLFGLAWIARRDDGRAVRITELGQRELPQHLGMPASGFEPERRP